ncbi:MFS-type transporter SLC18B1-like [Neocloeon triangulifer]|uniref:MFS-type transporter SLC18B1-like n=1 Tax=Neocloeon triangulifer TaxID=2078957 RepID=UPI00286F7E28|nr:MFS-type transporter SLC18B1-like [Neocloeon triangulifer]
MVAKFSRRQWLTLMVFGIANFCNAICVSLQAPFYPMEAERKGATATEYGLVFGVFELVVFLISPIYGRHLNRIGPKYLFNGGIFTVGTCAILFGLLDRVEGHYPFIVLSFVIRIVEALGNAAFLTASFAIIAKEFPDNVATTFASLETFFGLGLITGPTVGGALYQVGGYTTPFAVMGSALFLSAVMTALVLPDHGDSDIDAKTGPSMLAVLKIPGVLLAACSIVATSISIGFLQATLEPHLRQFELSPVVLGLMFVVNGGTYALTAPCFGWLCDRYVDPKVITVFGSLLVIFGFSLIGPAPYLPFDTLLSVSIVGLVSHGLGMAAQLVASFTDALRTAFEHGYPNNLETYGLISGLWTSTFALGACIGPSIAGCLFDSVGFRHSTTFVVGSHVLVGIAVTVFLVFGRQRGPYKDMDDSLSTDNTSDTLVIESTDLSNSYCRSGKHRRKTLAGSISIERPPGMINGLSVCSSYKNKYGTWQREDGSSVLIGPYSSSYGSIELGGRAPLLTSDTRAA